MTKLNKILIILLALIILGGIFYFLFPLKTEAPESTNQNATSTESAPVYTFTTKTIKTENKQKSYSIKASYPVFALAKGTIEKKINDSVANLANEEINSFKSSFDDTRTSSFQPVEDDDASTFELNFTVLPNKQLKNILLIRFEETFYSAGAAHPGESILTANYNLQTGEMLTLSDLFESGAPYLQTLSSDSIKALKKKLGSNASTDEIETGAEPKEDNFKNFLVTDQGLNIIFNEYQVGPYAAGVQEITLPWISLKDILNPSLNLI